MRSLVTSAESLWAAAWFPSWDRRQVESFQSRRLRALVRHAYERVAFYRELYDRHGVRPEDVRGVEELGRLPVARRGEMQERAAGELVARGVDPARLVRHRTSGSTGYPFTIRRTLFEERLLLWLRLRQQFRRGLRLSDRRASVALGWSRGDESPGERLLRRLGWLRRHSVSCLLPAREILRELGEYGPDTLAGYPDALVTIASEATEEDRRRIRPRFITTGGETLTPDMRRRISERFGAPVYDTYGAHEFLLLAYECRETGLYHVAEESVLLEVLQDGRPVSPGETGEVVATALHSFAMPFLRYWVGDLAVRGPARCPCGAPCATLERILGRVIDRFLLPDGTQLHPYHLLEPLVHEAPWLSRYQIVQESVDRVVLKMVPIGGAKPSEEDLSRLRAALAKPLGPQVTLVFEMVQELPPAGSGKFRPYYSKVRG